MDNSRIEQMERERRDHKPCAYSIKWRIDCFHSNNNNEALNRHDVSPSLYCDVRRKQILSIY